MIMVNKVLTRGYDRLWLGDLRLESELFQSIADGFGRKVFFLPCIYGVKFHKCKDD